VKNCNNGKSGKKEFLRLLSGRKSMHFSAMECCEKYTGRNNTGKGKQKRVNCGN
jgi:hypothetical protein